MKPTDFAYHLTTYLSKYLPGRLGISRNTIWSYRGSLFFCAFVPKKRPLELKKSR